MTYTRPIQPSNTPWRWLTQQFRESSTLPLQHRGPAVLESFKKFCNKCLIRNLWLSWTHHQCTAEPTMMRCWIFFALYMTTHPDPFRMPSGNSYCAACATVTWLQARLFTTALTTVVLRQNKQGRFFSERLFGVSYPRKLPSFKENPGQNRTIVLNGWVSFILTGICWGK